MPLQIDLGKADIFFGLPPSYRFFDSVIPFQANLICYNLAILPSISANVPVEVSAVKSLVDVLLPAADSREAIKRRAAKITVEFLDWRIASSRDIAIVGGDEKHSKPKPLR